MSFKYAGKGGAGAGFGKPNKVFKEWNLIYDFISGAFVLLLPFLHLLPKSKGFLPAASFCSH